MKKFYYLFFCLYFIVLSCATAQARITRTASAALPQKIPAKKLFPLIAEEISEIYNNKKSGSLPVLITMPGRSGSGQSTSANKLLKYLIENTPFQTVQVIGCDNYLIPKNNRITLAKSPFPKKGEILNPKQYASFGKTEKIENMLIKGIDENTIEIKIPSSEWIKVDLSEKGKEQEIYTEGNKIFFSLTKQTDNSIIIHVPTFISKIDWNFYKDILALQKGNSIAIPLFDQKTREPKKTNKDNLTGTTVDILGKDFYIIDEEKNIISDKNGYLFQKILPQGIIIAEGVWVSLRPEIKPDIQIFVTAAEEQRDSRAGIRYILEKRYENDKVFLFDILTRSRKDWWEEQEPYAQAQEKNSDYRLDTNTSMTEGKMASFYGTEDIRIQESIQRYYRDASKLNKEISAAELLQYAWYVLQEKSPLKKIVALTIEALENGSFHNEIFKNSLDNSKNSTFSKLNASQKSIYEYLMIKAGLFKNTENQYTASWMNQDFQKMFNDEIPKEFIPLHVRLLAEKTPILEKWGFDKLTNLAQAESIENIAEASNLFVCALYNYITWQTVNSMVKIPPNPRILSLGSGKFYKEYFMLNYFKPSVLYAVEKNPETLKNSLQLIKKFGAEKQLSEGLINIIQDDLTNYSNIFELKSKTFDILITRIVPNLTIPQLENILNTSKKTLSKTGSLILHIRHSQLNLDIPKKIISAVEKHGLINFGIYPISGETSSEEKDYFVIIKKENIEKFTNSLH